MKKRTMRILCLAVSILALIAGQTYAGQAAVKFTAQPSVSELTVKDGNITGAKISFAIDRETDVKISVVDANGKIIRHLGHAVLGENAPEPFKKGSLSQTISWDGLDDKGNPVPAGKGFKVTVGAAVNPTFLRTLAHDPMTFNGCQGITVDGAGNVYAIIQMGEFREASETIYLLDRNGAYQRSIYQPNPNTHASYVNAQQGEKDGSVIRSSVNRFDYRGLQWSSDGLLHSIATDHSDQNNALLPALERRWSSFKTDGTAYTLEHTSPAPNYHLPWEPHHPGMIWFTLTSNTTALVSDGTRLDKDSAEFNWYYQAAQWALSDTIYANAVYALNVGSGAISNNNIFTYSGTTAVAARNYLGTPPTGTWGVDMQTHRGDDGSHFNGPRGVAVDNAGNIYVADCYNNKIKKFRSDGYYEGAISTYTDTDASTKTMQYPSGIIFNKKNNNLYVVVDVPNDTSVTGKILVKLTSFANPTALAKIFVHDAAMYPMAIDTGVATPHIWLPRGNGFASFSKYVDNGTSFAATHFAGRANQRGIISGSSLDVDPATGYVWATENNGLYSRAVKINPVNNEVTVVAEMAGNSDVAGNGWPRPNWGTKIRFGSDGYLYGHNYNGIFRTNPATVSRTTHGLIAWPDAHKIDSMFYKTPGGVYNGVDHWGVNYYVPGTQRTILKSGQSGLAGGISYYRGMAVDPTGNVYQMVMKISSTNPLLYLEKFSQGGDSITAAYPIAGTTVPLAIPRDIEVAEDGSYWVSSGDQFARYAVDNSVIWGPKTGSFGKENRCGCKTARVESDPNKLFYFPNMTQKKIYVYDAAGNEVTSFGAYGNLDCRGTETPSNPIPAIPFQLPIDVSAQTTSNVVYVLDQGNNRVVAVIMDPTLSIDISLDGNENSGKSIKDYNLTQNFPNPFNPVTSIFYQLPAKGKILLAVYDTKGQKVKTLVNGIQEANSYQVAWKGENDAGLKVASGTYLYKMSVLNPETGKVQFTKTVTMTLIK